MKNFVKKLGFVLCFSFIAFLAICFVGCGADAPATNMQKKSMLSSITRPKPEETILAETEEKSGNEEEIETDEEDEDAVYYNITISPTRYVDVYLNILRKREADVCLTDDVVRPGDVVIVDYIVNKGFELDKITANGTEIAYKNFIVGEEDVVVKAYIKPKTTTIAKEKHAINIDKSQLDLITVETKKAEAEEGEVISLTYEINSAYNLDYFMINGAQVSETSFIMPNSDVTIIPVISLKPVAHKISGTSNENVSISASKTSAYEGESITISCNILNDVYKLDYFMVNGEKINGEIFIMPNEDVVISATLVEKTVDELLNIPHEIVAKSYRWAGIALYADKSEAKCGEIITLSYTQSDPNYEMGGFYVNNEYLGKNVNTFVMPYGPVKISTNIIDGYYNETCIDFSDLFDDDCYWVRNYLISFETVEGIAISTESCLAKHGSTIQIRYTVAEGYKLCYFTVNGEKIVGTSFKMPMNNVVISAATQKLNTESGDSDGASGLDSDDYDNVISGSDIIWIDWDGFTESDVNGDEQCQTDIFGAEDPWIEDCYDDIDYWADVLGSGDNYIGGENGIGQIGEIDDDGGFPELDDDNSNSVEFDVSVFFEEDDDEEEEDGKNWSPVVPLH